MTESAKRDYVRRQGQMEQNWEALFLEARELIKDEVDRHEVSCGCQDKGDPAVEGVCPGLLEQKRFLVKTLDTATAVRKRIRTLKTPPDPAPGIPAGH